MIDITEKEAAAAEKNKIVKAVAIGVEAVFGIVIIATIVFGLMLRAIIRGIFGGGKRRRIRRKTKPI